MDRRKRCTWAGTDPLYVDYHDREWGVPEHGDQRLFEMLVLEGAQAGLSWITILRKREAYRRAFAKFDPRKVARFDGRAVRRLMRDAGIVRNRAKIESAVRNAKVFLEIQREFGSFDRFLWGFVGGKPRINRWRGLGDIPASTDESVALSKELKRRGMGFVGPIGIYAYMQSIGIVLDHTLDCFRYRELCGKHRARD